MLTEDFIANLPPAETDAVRYLDDKGLFLRVATSGRKSWYLRCQVAGKKTIKALGKYPTMSLADARKAADKMRNNLASGLPALEKDFPPDRFQAFAEKWLETKKSQIEEKSVSTIRIQLRTHVYPKIGNRAVGSIRAVECFDLLQAIGQEAPATARKVCSILARIFTYATVFKACDQNPINGLSEYLPKEKATHLPAMLEAEDIKRLFAACVEYTTKEPRTLTTGRALQFQALTAVRPGNIPSLKWKHLDLEKKIWTIPAALMKQDREHRVPLTDQALAILKAQSPLTGYDDENFVFGNKLGKPISKATLTTALQSMGFHVVAHGWRASFSTWANEAGANPDVIELCLAHGQTNQVRAAYNRSEHWEDRISLMNQWSTFLTKDENENK